MWLMARLAHYNIGFIDWEPYIPFMFTRFLRSFHLPVTYKHVQQSRTYKIDTSAMALWIVSVMVCLLLFYFFHILFCHHHSGQEEVLQKEGGTTPPAGQLWSVCVYIYHHKALYQSILQGVASPYSSTF